MTRITRVVPAILTEDAKVLETMVRQAEGFTDYVQFDFMDGRFVPSRSITYKHLLDIPMELSWEAHLMVENPEKYLEGLRAAGARRVVFHFEATTSPLQVISKARRLGLGVGLAVNPETPVPDRLTPASEVDNVLFLTVHPGFYGSRFIVEVLDKVAEFRNINPGVEIGVDGGIKESNIAQVSQVGVDVVYVGSAVFLQPEPGESFRRLVVLAEEGSQKRVQ